MCSQASHAKVLRHVCSCVTPSLRPGGSIAYDPREEQGRPAPRMRADFHRGGDLRK